MIKAVIFDMDGTVLDTEKLYTKYWGLAVEQSGFTISYEDLLGLRSLGWEYAQDYFEKVLGPTWKNWRINFRMPRENWMRHKRPMTGRRLSMNVWNRSWRS